MSGRVRSRDGHPSIRPCISHLSVEPTSLSHLFPHLPLPFHSHLFLGKPPTSVRNNLPSSTSRQTPYYTLIITHIVVCSFHHQYQHFPLVMSTTTVIPRLHHNAQRVHTAKWRRCPGLRQARQLRQVPHQQGGEPPGQPVLGLLRLHAGAMQDARLRRLHRQDLHDLRRTGISKSDHQGRVSPDHPGRRTV